MSRGTGEDVIRDVVTVGKIISDKTNEPANHEKPS